MDCYSECERILKHRSKGIIRRVFNKNDPWCRSPIFQVSHIRGSSKIHYIIDTTEGTIIDPFLQERGQIPEEDYLRIAYRNNEELRIS